MADTFNQAEVKKRYPVSSGLTAGTTKTEGRQTNLIPTKGSLVKRGNKVGMVD